MLKLRFKSSTHGLLSFDDIDYKRGELTWSLMIKISAGLDLAHCSGLWVSLPSRFFLRVRDWFFFLPSHVNFGCSSPTFFFFLEHKPN